MDERSAEKLDSIFAKKRAAIEKAKQDEANRASDYQRFVDAFQSMSTYILKPALESFVYKLKEQGVKVDYSTDQADLPTHILVIGNSENKIRNCTVAFGPLISAQQVGFNKGRSYVSDTQTVERWECENLTKEIVWQVLTDVVRMTDIPL